MDNDLLKFLSKYDTFTGKELGSIKDQRSLGNSCSSHVCVHSFPLQMKRFVFTVITVCFANFAYCCTCIMYSLESQFDSVESVVTVKVVELLEEDAKYEIERYFPEKRSYRAKVKIIRSFKGVPQPEEIIVMDSHYANCDPEFAIGEEYLLFLDSNGDMYKNRACTNWGLVSDSKKYIWAIDRLIKKR